MSGRAWPNSPRIRTNRRGNRAGFAERVNWRLTGAPEGLSGFQGTLERGAIDGRSVSVTRPQIGRRGGSGRFLTAVVSSRPPEKRAPGWKRIPSRRDAQFIFDGERRAVRNGDDCSAGTGDIDIAGIFERGNSTDTRRGVCPRPLTAQSAHPGLPSAWRHRTRASLSGVSSETRSAVCPRRGPCAH